MAIDGIPLSEGTAFSTGAFLGALLLCAGILVGILIGRRLSRQVSGLSADDVLKIIAQFKTVTHGVAEDMSQYRQVMGLAQRRMHDLQENPADHDDSPLQLLGQITEANELLQQRIAEAEATISRQSEEMAAAMNEARTDKLTGLANRRAFEDEFQRRTAEFRRHGTSFLLVLLDIDRFKQLNDTLGHPAGDAVLTQFAGILRQTVRDTDLVARFGGEEFVLLLPAGELSQVSDSIERIRRAVEKAEFTLEDRMIHVTTSCGAAQPLERESSDSLVKRADSALYAAKQAGRNRSFFHTGTACVPLTPEGSRIGSTVAPQGDFRQVCADLRRKLEEVTKR